MKYRLQVRTFTMQGCGKTESGNMDLQTAYDARSVVHNTLTEKGYVYNPELDLYIAFAENTTFRVRVKRQED